MGNRLDQQVISPREIEVLNLLCKGMTAKEIATQLYISQHTVVSHRKNLITKLEARNSLHMAYLAVTRGLLAL